MIHLVTADDEGSREASALRPADMAGSQSAVGLQHPECVSRCSLSYLAGIQWGPVATRALACGVAANRGPRGGAEE